ncbi:hypothetical protein D3Y57_09890 [Sphingomonas paeninsulae]|uniref:Uncharacterized protein n=1 Tax=Sphingomonas paeninsulae TaxID=2319844 RepID=A0A494TK87_SPHPE|nr:hypothetical protein [Sphingomonas paeninsulae]AYJ86221.1 hypothetical protein D3Y57_09890 [Sphingomonas paeninsulae]
MKTQIIQALAQLTDHQRQLDVDGTLVGVSRQAVDEVVADHTRLRYELSRVIAEREDARSRLNRIAGDANWIAALATPTAQPVEGDIEQARECDVERVARALHGIEDSWNDTAWEYVPAGTQRLFLAQAEAAITAMRPTSTGRGLSLLLADCRQALFDSIKVDDGATASTRFEIGRAIGLMGRAMDNLQPTIDAAIRGERERCAALALKEGAPGPCENVGFMCSETGVRDCSLGDLCRCDTQVELSDRIAAAIRTHPIDHGPGESIGGAFVEVVK